MPGDFGDSRGIKRGQVRESDHGDWERERSREKGEQWKGDETTISLGPTKC